MTSPLKPAISQIENQERKYSHNSHPISNFSTTNNIRNVSNVTEGSRVVGREYGEHRLISVTERVDESRSKIIGERVVEQEIKVPRKIVREEIIEKIIVVPEKIITEEIVDDIQIVRQKVIEVSKPTIIEKVIEVPEIEVVEKIIEVPEKVVQERIVEQPRYIKQERIVPIERYQNVEKVVEVPEIHYRDVHVEKTVEIPDYKEEIIIKQVQVPQYIEKPVANFIKVEHAIDIRRDLPIPVEAEITYEYRMPQLKPRYSKVTYPVYLPRFIEVPVAKEVLTEDLCRQAEQYLTRISGLTKSAVSLCEIEGLAAKIMNTDFQSHLAKSDLHSAVLNAWNSNSLDVVVPENTTHVGTTVTAA